MKKFIVFLLLVSCMPEKNLPSVPKDEIDFAVSGIENYNEVLDAAISQKGNDLSLALIVNNGTSSERAKELGDNFLRLTMSSISIENKPQKEIGESQYTYLVGVYYPDQSKVVMGAKVDFARRITW